MQGALLILISLIVHSFGAKLPPDFPICKIGDPKELNACMKEAVPATLVKLKDGIPTLHIPSAEPLEIKSATLAEGTGPVRLTPHFENIKAYNFTQTIINDIDVSITEKAFNFIIKGRGAEYRTETDYKIDGQVLLVPIKGEGHATIQSFNASLELALSGEIYEKKGKRYLKVTSSKIDFNPEKMVFNFDNLFGGDNVLGTQMNKLINDNWKDVFQDLKGPLAEIQAAVVQNYVNSVISQVPFDDLFPK